MKVGPMRVLYAVQRPGCVEVGCVTWCWEVPIVDRVRQVPVPGGAHEREVSMMKLQECRDARGDFSATRHRETSTLGEVVLDIDDQECGLHGHAAMVVIGSDARSGDSSGHPDWLAGVVMMVSNSIEECIALLP